MFLVLICLVLVLLAASSAGAAWQAPIDLSDAGRPAYHAQVALDSRGDAVAVWTRANGTSFIVQSKRRPAGGSWQSLANLSLTGQNANYPDVAVDPRGNAVAVWGSATYPGGTFQVVVQGAEMPAGANWTFPVNLSITGDRAQFPRVGVDAQGNAVAVWSSSSGVYAAERPAGAVWQSPLQLSQGYGLPQIAVNPRGAAVAVWKIHPALTTEFAQGAARPAGGTWQPSVNLSAKDPSLGNPQVALNAKGDAVAIWRRGDASNAILQSAVRTAAGTWGEPVNVTSLGQDANKPDVAIDDQGNALAVWESYDGTSHIVQSAVRLAGARFWKSPVNLSSAGQDAFAPQVATNPQGTAFAVWERPDGTNVIVQARKGSRGTWQSVSNLSLTGKAHDPQVAVDLRGNAVAVWWRSQGDTSQSAVFRNVP